MRTRLWMVLFATAAAVGCRSGSDHSLRSVAIRVHDMNAMLQFYAAAFGFTFEPVDTDGLASQFGRRGDLTLKFVPLRDSADFIGFPSHQLGFGVADVDAVVALATRYGGRAEGAPRIVGDSIHAAVRDPDGNTIELYGPRRSPASSP